MPKDVVLHNQVRELLPPQTEGVEPVGSYPMPTFKQDLLPAFLMLTMTCATAFGAVSGIKKAWPKLKEQPTYQRFFGQTGASTNQNKEAESLPQEQVIAQP